MKKNFRQALLKYSVELYYFILLMYFISNLIMIDKIIRVPCYSTINRTVLILTTFNICMFLISHDNV